MAWKEKEFEEKMRPYIDVIYQKTFKNISKILRVNREEKTNSKFMIMDRDLAIDTHLYFRDGTLLTFQEKTRQHIYQKYQDLLLNIKTILKTMSLGNGLSWRHSYIFLDTPTKLKPDIYNGGF